ncbi:MAG TPA: UMP kinase [Deltaproteobacteria bacterium]|nr:UMP kinase [Deltaproteobacteria bacterium]
MHYRRILLKLSGEALAGEKGFGIDTRILDEIVSRVKEATESGVSVALVIGGGNFFRGTQADEALDRVTADSIGMLATVMNALAFRAALAGSGVTCCLMSALAIPGVAAPVDIQEARRRLDGGEVVIFAGGTGNPFFSTDTNAALRALEVGADVLVKATKVDGIYDRDPVKDPGAVFFRELDYDEVLAGRLAVMDATAVSLCRENGLELRVINIFDPLSLKRLVAGEEVGTTVRGRRKDRGG